VTSPADPDDTFVRANAAQRLARVLFHHTDVYTSHIADAFQPGDPTSSWDEVPLDLDGQSTVFRLLASGDWWVAVGNGPGCLISIEAHNISAQETHLVEIDNTDLYLSDDGAL